MILCAKISLFYDNAIEIQIKYCNFACRILYYAENNEQR